MIALDVILFQVNVANKFWLCQKPNRTTQLGALQKLPKPKIVASVLIVCLGIFVATVTDSQVSECQIQLVILWNFLNIPTPKLQMVSNISGMVIGMSATLVTALYQSWAGSKQKELRASSMQLLQAYTPHATLLLGILTPLCEQVGHVCVEWFWVFSSRACMAC